MDDRIKKKNIIILFLNYLKKIFGFKKKEKEKNSDDIYPMW